MLLVGDADFASAAYLPMQANRNLFLNGVAWLCRQSNLVSIRRDQLAGQKIDLADSDPPLIYGASFAAPVLVLLAGVVVALRRRGL